MSNVSYRHDDSYLLLDKPHPNIILKTLPPQSKGIYLAYILLELVQEKKMKCQSEKPRHDPTRMVYWTRIYFESDNNLKKTKILTAASQEYLSDTYLLSGKKEITDKHLELWIKSVIEKWSNFGNEIFKNKTHYDGYVSNKKDESNIIDFLVNTVKV